MNWNPVQQQRLDAYDVPRSVDVHCHVLPGLDDGPATWEDSLDLCRALAGDGVTSVVATPHQMGIFDRQNLAPDVRDLVDDLRQRLSEAEIPLELAVGGDVRIDERIPKYLETGQLTTVGDQGHHLLLELPHEGFVDPRMLISALKHLGIQVIMTHPERHRYLHGSTQRLQAWIDDGAVIQVTAGSLLGDFGNRAMDEAWRLVDAGMVSIVATDSHDIHRRPPRFTEVLELLGAEIGREAARLLCLHNPYRVWQGEAVPHPLAGTSEL